MSKQLLKGSYDELGAYLRDIADRVGLKDWYFNIVHEPPDDQNHAACVEVYYGRKVADIRFRNEWATWTPEELRETVLHELLHCHINPLRFHLNNIQNAVGQMVYEPLYQGVTDYIEYAVDGIARNWAQTLPLPVKAKKRKDKAQ